MIKRIDNNSVRLCCKGSGCPIVTELDNGLVEIVDDSGNRIVIKKEEALLISDGVKVIDNKEQLLLE